MLVKIKKKKKLVLKLKIVGSLDVSFALLPNPRTDNCAYGGERKERKNKNKNKSKENELQISVVK